MSTGTSFAALLGFGFALALLFSTVNTKECTLVPPEKEVDWDMLPGNWYHILNTRDPVESSVTCFNIRDLRGSRVEDGFYVTFEAIHAKASETNECNMIPVHWKSHGNFYKKDKNFEFLWTTKVKDSPNKRSQQLKEIDSFYTLPETFHTDYVNYIFGLFCDPEGKKFIWVHSRNPYPLEEDILRVKQKIATLGHGWDEVKLYPSTCRTLTNFGCSIYN